MWLPTTQNCYCSYFPTKTHLSYRCLILGDDYAAIHDQRVQLLCEKHEERNTAIIYLECSVSDENFCYSYFNESNSTSNRILNEFYDLSLAPRQLTLAMRSAKVQSGTMSIFWGTIEAGEKATCMQLPCPSHRGCCWVSSSGLKLPSSEVKIAYPETCSPMKMKWRPRNMRARGTYGFNRACLRGTTVNRKNGMKAIFSTILFYLTQVCTHQF